MILLVCLLPIYIYILKIDLVNDFLNYYYRLNGFLWHPRIFHSYFSLEHLQTKKRSFK